MNLDLVSMKKIAGWLKHKARSLTETFPKEEIDEDARQLIVRDCSNALRIADAHVQRSQWSKPSNDAPERTARVKRKVQELLQTSHG